MTVSINATAIIFNDSTSQNTVAIANVTNLASGNGAIADGANTSYLRFKRLNMSSSTGSISANASTVLYSYTAPVGVGVCSIGG
jgi:hypothetical protein